MHTSEGRVMKQQKPILCIIHLYPGIRWRLNLHCLVLSTTQTGTQKSCLTFYMQQQLVKAFSTKPCTVARKHAFFSSAVHRGTQTFNPPTLTYSSGEGTEGFLFHNCIVPIKYVHLMGPMLEINEAAKSDFCGEQMLVIIQYPLGRSHSKAAYGQLCCLLFLSGLLSDII